MGTITALLSLVEDDDPIIQREVVSKFKTLGLSGRYLLIDHLNEIKSQETLQNLEAILDHLLDYYIEEQIEYYKYSNNLLDFFHLISLVFNSYVNKELYENFFKETNDICRTLIKESYTVKQRLICISDILFRTQKFRNIQFDIQNPMYSLLDSVISNKKGDTLSLCFIYYEVAKLIGIPLQFVFYTEFCMLKLDAEDTVFIDVSGNGNLLSADECKLLLEINYINIESEKQLSLDQTLIFYINWIISMLGNTEERKRLEFVKKQLF